MSPTTVDNRAVQMGFDNKQFESGVKQSVQSLDQLKKSLDLTESAKSIENLSSVSRKFSLEEMGKGISNISSKFSALGVIGFTVLQNLTNAAIQYGKKIVSNITTPIKTGFSEYETQINAIQTVLANTEAQGTTLEDVSAALDELNTYADKTIYNFTEMTRNIGTFTAAGVTLETSTQAIKGIANLAAVSGSTSQQASTAMYQLSQALSSGTVKLMDWNSVVNAGMGGQVFQEALKETARVSGIAIDDLIDKHGSFRETLQTGWLSSEVLLDTLKKFTGDLNEEQLKTMGYNEEQIEGILRLGQTANDAATKVKTFSQLQETLAESLQSGWTKSWEIILGDFEEAKSLFTEISDTLGGLIGSSSDARNAILQSWKDWGGRTAAIETLRNTFNGLLSILSPIKEAFSEVFKPLTGYQLYKITDAIRKLSEKFILSGESADKVKRIFKGLFSGLSLIKDVIFTLTKYLFGFVKISNISGAGIVDFLVRIGDFLTKLRESTDVGELFKIGIENIGKTLSSAKVSLIAFGNIIKEKFTNTKKWFVDAFDIDLSTIGNFFDRIKERISNISDIFKSVDFSGIGTFFDKIKERFSGLTTLSTGAAGAVGGLSAKLTALSDTFKEISDTIRPFVEKVATKIKEELGKINYRDILSAINTGIFAAILLAIRNFLKSGSGFLDEAGGIFGGLTGILDGVRGSLEAWQQNLKAKTLLMIAGAIAVLVASLVVLSLIDSEKLLVGVGVITGLFANLVVSLKAFSAIGGGSSQAVTLIGISVAILIMAGALAKIADIDTDKVGVALAAIGGMLTEVGVFMKTVKTADKGIVLQMIGLSLAIMQLGKVVQRFGEMDPEEMKQGLLAMGVVLGEIAAFTRIQGTGGKGGISSKSLISSAVGLAILAGSLLLISKVIAEFGKMDWEELGRGLAGVGGALLIIATTMRLMPKNMVFTAVGLVAVSLAMMLLGQVLKSFGNMSWEEIGKGLGVLAGSMTILAVSLIAMSGTLAGSFALLIAVGALTLLTPVLLVLGSMDLAAIGTALLALAGVFAVLGLAGLLLTPVVPTLLLLSVALVLLGGGMALAGLGISLFAAGLAAIAVSGLAFAATVVAATRMLLPLVPLLVDTLISAIIRFGEGIIKATPVIGKAIEGLIMELLRIIRVTAPELFETLGVLLDELIELITTKIPDFVSAVVDLLTTLLEEIALKLPDFLEAGFDILIELLQGIRDNIGEVVTVVTEIITEFLGALGDNIPDIIQAGWDLILDFINGLTAGIEDNMTAILTAAGELAAAFISGVVQGILGGGGAVISAIVGLVTGAKQAALDEAEAESPSKVFMRIGETFPQGMALGITKLSHLVDRSLEDLTDDAVNGMRDVSLSIVDALTSDIDMSPTIRPVIDMTDVVSNGKLIDEILDSKTLNLVPAIVSSSRIAGSMNTPKIDSNGNIITEGTNINMIQNNYSPKALSPIEIYRQTNRQIQALKGLGKK